MSSTRSLATSPITEAPATARGLSIGPLLSSAPAVIDEVLLALRPYGLRPPDVAIACVDGRLHVTLRASTLAAWCPDSSTLSLHQLDTGVQLDATQRLELETLVAMLAAPQALSFPTIDAWWSSMRVRRNVALAARKTALAFKTAAAERPACFWREDPDHGFVLQPGVSLIEALIAATQPEATGRLYDFSCYRATEYVILLGIAQELEAHHPALLADLQARCERQVIRSGQFHDVFLVEYGSLEAPLPMHYYVPGDRVWFRNPDVVSSDASGYEGSWVIYLGAGRFSNFWKQAAPYALEDKCIEVFHWRDGVFIDSQGDPRIDETPVELACEITHRNPKRMADILQRMKRMRDPKGVYAEGGCIDCSREFARSVWVDSCELQLPR